MLRQVKYLNSPYARQKVMTSKHNDFIVFQGPLGNTLHTKRATTAVLDASHRVVTFSGEQTVEVNMEIDVK